MRILSHPIETVLAEKLETVVSRGIANTRGRYFYDIHTLLRLKSKDIDRRSLREAIAATTSKRGSTGGCPITQPSLKKSENLPPCRASGLLASPVSLCSGNRLRGHRRFGPRACETRGAGRARTDSRHRIGGPGHSTPPLLRQKLCRASVEFRYLPQHRPGIATHRLDIFGRLQAR